jgi:hypothetical protein
MGHTAFAVSWPLPNMAFMATTMTPGEHLAALDRTRASVLACFHLGSDILACRYAPGKWTARQVLLHIVDTETVQLDRLRRILAEDAPVLAAFDQDRWTARLGGEGRPLTEARALFLAARATMRRLVAGMSAEDWCRTGVHTVRGPMTAEAVIILAHGHCAHHGEQITAVAAGRTWMAT